MKPVIKVALTAVAYFATFILGAASGAIHPACYAYVGALLPLLFAFPYLYACSLIRGFGAAAVLNGFILVLFLVSGEADTGYVVITLMLTALSEILRRAFGYDTDKGIRVSFIPFAFSFFAYTSHWWTDTDGSLAAAVAEMPQGYDQQMLPIIENIPALIIVLVLTVPVAILSMRGAQQFCRRSSHIRVKKY